MAATRFSCQGQSLPETAILLGVVVIAVVAIQTYVRRSLQARIAVSVRHESSPGGGGGIAKLKPMQYEPYYLEGALPDTVVSNTPSNSKTAMNYTATPKEVHATMTSNSVREKGAFQDEYPPRP